jgi:hypothetical protein
MQTKAEVALQVVQADLLVRAESSSTLVAFRPKVALHPKVVALAGTVMRP